jgi:hypothetical protein
MTGGRSGYGNSMGGEKARKTEAQDGLPGKRLNAKLNRRARPASPDGGECHAAGSRRAGR